MKRTVRVSLTIALAATSLQAFVPAFLAAQPPESGFTINPPNLALDWRGVQGPIPAPYASIESINAATRRVTLREIRFGADRKSIPTNPITLQLAANASVVRLEPAISANQLKVFDMVTLLGRKAPMGLVNFVPRDANGHLVARAGRATGRAEGFEVVAVFPQLTLRRGGVPADASGNTSFLKTPFFDGSEGDVGFLSLDRAVDGAQTVVTLMLTKTEELQFNRFAPVTLREIAPLLAADKIHIKAEISNLTGGQREVTRMVVSDAK